MPILPLIQLLTPFVPLIQKAIAGVKDKEVIKKSKGVSEVAHVSYLAALALIFQDVSTCGSLACVTPEHWGLLVIGVVVGVSRHVSKQRVVNDV